MSACCPTRRRRWSREWRSFDRNGSALGALINLGWVALAACLALLAERLSRAGLSRRLRRRCGRGLQGRAAGDLLLLLLCDALGLAVFAGRFRLQPPLADGCRRHAEPAPACGQCADPLARLRAGPAHRAAPARAGGAADRYSGRRGAPPVAVPVGRRCWRSWLLVGFRPLRARR